MATENICPKCIETREEGHLFCPLCGTKLVVQLKGLLPIEYRNTYNTWHVTTEGDCNAFTTRDLGIHRGQIDEIAKALAHKSNYKLSFEPVKISVVPESARQSVCIELRDSTVIGMAPADRVKALKQYFAHRPVAVRESDYYGSVELVFLNSIQSSSIDYK